MNENEYDKYTMIHKLFAEYSFSLSILIVGILTLLGSFLIHILLVNKGNKKVTEMAQTGLVVVSNFSKLSHILASAKSHVSKTLYVSFAPTLRLPLLSYSEHVSGIYTQSIQICNNLDIRVLMETLKNPSLKETRTLNPIDLVIFDHHPKSELKEFARSHFSNLTDDFSVMNIDDEESFIQKDGGLELGGKTFDYVALGGTFDRLHTGHKILLSQGVLRANKHLTVGVTDVNMIKSKKLWELIEPINIRINTIKQFLNDIDPSLEYNVVPIQDMYGPTKDDPRLQLLVVSQETIKGGDKVNEKRLENKLSPMEVYCIELAGESQIQSEEEEAKVSSSNRRMRLLGTVLREPEVKLDLPAYPYIIGLTGGIASGKTKIAERLGKMGAGVVYCDLLAHELYRPGQPMNATMAETFGQDIITSNGEVDRKKLGNIVFNDPTKLIELNNLLWPAILELALQRAQELGRQGYRVVVMEAAVLVQADWYKHCHQVWTSIIPPEEAIKRLKERNGLSEQAAKDRLASQPSNTEQVAAANVVFSSQWSYEFTTSQVQRAWDNLLIKLDGNKLKSNM